MGFYTSALEQKNEILHETETKYNLQGVELLKEAISHEFDIGLNTLSYVYSLYFFVPLPSVPLKFTNCMKQWFLVVRSG